MTSVLAVQPPPTRETLPPPTAAPAFPPDLATWIPAAGLLRLADASVTRAGCESWFADRTGTTPAPVRDDLLVLVSYCYLRGIYHSMDIVRRLETDPILREFHDRSAFRVEQVRRLRRDRRRSITDSMARAFATLWERRLDPAGMDTRRAGIAGAGRLEFGRLEPFQLLAQDRIDRAVVFDSMALDD